MAQVYHRCLLLAFSYFVTYYDPVQQSELVSHLIYRVLGFAVLL